MEEEILPPKFASECSVIRMYEDGKIEVFKNLLFTSSKDYNPLLSNSPNGYIVLSMVKDNYCDKFIISSYKAVLESYLEGFIFGRNIDYITYQQYTDSLGFFEILIKSFEKIVTPNL